MRGRGDIRNMRLRLNCNKYEIGNNVDVLNKGSISVGATRFGIIRMFSALFFFHGCLGFRGERLFRAKGGVN